MVRPIYVVLPSNTVTEKEGENKNENKIGHFKVKFPRPLRFKRPTTVSVHNVIIPYSWNPTGIPGEKNAIGLVLFNNEEIPCRIALNRELRTVEDLEAFINISLKREIEKYFNKVVLRKRLKRQTDEHVVMDNIERELNIDKSLMNILSEAEIFKDLDEGIILYYGNTIVKLTKKIFSSVEDAKKTPVIKLDDIYYYATKHVHIGELQDLNCDEALSKINYVSNEVQDFIYDSVVYEFLKGFLIYISVYTNEKKIITHEGVLLKKYEKETKTIRKRHAEQSEAHLSSPNKIPRGDPNVWDDYLVERRTMNSHISFPVSKMSKDTADQLAKWYIENALLGISVSLFINSTRISDLTASRGVKATSIITKIAPVDLDIPNDRIIWKDNSGVLEWLKERQNLNKSVKDFHEELREGGLVLPNYVYLPDGSVKKENNHEDLSKKTFDDIVEVFTNMGLIMDVLVSKPQATDAVKSKDSQSKDSKSTESKHEKPKSTEIKKTDQIVAQKEKIESVITSVQKDSTKDTAVPKDSTHSIKPIVSSDTKIVETKSEKNKESHPPSVESESKPKTIETKESKSESVVTKESKSESVVTKESKSESVVTKESKQDEIKEIPLKQNEIKGIPLKPIPLVDPVLPEQKDENKLVISVYDKPIDLNEMSKEEFKLVLRKFGHQVPELMNIVFKNEKNLVTDTSNILKPDQINLLYKNFFVHNKELVNPEDLTQESIDHMRRNGYSLVCENGKSRFVKGAAIQPSPVVPTYKEEEKIETIYGIPVPFTPEETRKSEEKTDGDKKKNEWIDPPKRDIDLSYGNQQRLAHTHVKFDYLNNCFVLHCPEDLVKYAKVSDRISHMLGFTPGSYVLPGKPGYYPDIRGDIHQLYIYENSGFTENMIVGNESTNLMCIVNVGNAKMGDNIEVTSIRPIPKLVVVQELQEVEIEIRTNNNHPVPFHWGNVIITLLFKELDPYEGERDRTF